MIQKKSLKEAIQNPEIISVVGGLIGTATTNKDGLKPKYEAAIQNVNVSTISSGLYTKITADENTVILWKRTQYNTVPGVIFLSRGNNNTKSIGKAVSILGNFNLSTSTKIYVDSDGFYLQVQYSDYARNSFYPFSSSPISITQNVELPETAVEVSFTV